MQKQTGTRPCFTPTDIALWSASSAVIVLSFLLFDRENIMTLAASLIGVTSLIFCAKGNPVGQALMILFSLFYGAISWSFRYYGEMLTYLGMTMPMAALSFAEWLRHPFAGQRSQVQVCTLHRGDILPAAVLTAAVTFVFYFILAALRTANLALSTVSVATSFLAVYLTYRRSALYALAYAANDVVLILLWVLAAAANPSYWSVVVCFAAFLLNDLYGFVSWRKMQRRQEHARS